MNTFNTKYVVSLLLAGLLSMSWAFADKGGKAEIRRLANLAYENSLNNSDLGLEYAKELAVLAEQENEEYYQWYAILMQGVILNRSMNYSGALRALEEAYALKPDNFYSVYNLANTYRLLKDEKNTLLYDRKALELDSSKQAKIYSHLGLLYMEQKAFDKALGYFNKQLKASQKPAETFVAYLNFSFFYLNTKDYTKALVFLLKADNLEEHLNGGELNFKLEIASHWSNWGQYQIAVGNMEKAETYFKKSLKLAEELNYALILEECYKGLHQLSVFNKDMEMADHYWTKQLELNRKTKAQLTEYYEFLLNKQEQQTSLERIGKEELQKNFYAKLLLWSLLLFSLLLIGGFIFVNYKKSKFVKQLEIQNDEMACMESKIEKLQYHLLSRKEKAF